MGEEGQLQVEMFELNNNFDVGTLGATAWNLSTSPTLAAFIQHPWGGMYSDPSNDASLINESFLRLRQFFAGLPQTDATRPRWLLLSSALRSTPGTVIDLTEWATGTHISELEEGFGSEQEMYEAVARRVQTK